MKRATMSAREHVAFPSASRSSLKRMLTNPLGLGFLPTMVGDEPRTLSPKPGSSLSTTRRAIACTPSSRKPSASICSAGEWR